MSIKSEEFMRLALAEGKKASPLCLPNPPVGCVLVKAEVIIIAIEWLEY
jgi:pyrimidine deaminase RibD-like protein